MDHTKIDSIKKLINSFDRYRYEKELVIIEKRITNLRQNKPEDAGIAEYYQTKFLSEKERESRIKELEIYKKQIKELSSSLKKVLDELNTALYKTEVLSKKEVLLNALYYYTKSHVGKHGKIFFKSIGKIQNETRKINKEMYKLLKKNSKLNINRKISNSKHNIEMLFQSDFAEFSAKYRDKLNMLGVDLNKIKNARLDSENLLTWHGKEASEKLKNIEKVEKINVNIKGDYFKIKEKYTEIIELSKKTWYVEQILSAFSTTIIKDSEYYIGLQDLVKKQREELGILINKANKLYGKCKIQNKIDLIEQLEELYNKTEELKLQIVQCNKIGNYKQADSDTQEYYKLRYEMIKILKNNPDLNKQKYNIDIKNIIKKEMELFEPEIKKEIIKEESVRKTDIQSPVIKQQLENIELDENLQIQRTMHYQNYMKEKVLNSELGKLPFSSYLEMVAPHLIKLINFEKQIEKLARTIYKDYVNYYSSLENKKKAISFEEFSRKNYGVSNVAIPIESEDEYKVMVL